jgi:predicted small metal-binding protein
MSERKLKIQYNKELLQSLCKEYNILLLEDYYDVELTKKSDILSKCLTPNCKNNSKKKFGVLYKTGSYCVKCTTHNGNIKKEKTNILKFGSKNPFQSKEIKNKIKDSMIKNHGVEYPSQSTEIRQKSIESWKTNIGFDNPSQSPDIKIKKENTTLKNHGVKHTYQSYELRRQIKTTMKEKHGVEHPMHSEEIKNKLKQTNIERYGVENVMQNVEIQNKAHSTNIIRYGVKHPAQNADVAEKASKKALAFYNYIFPSGRIERIQGYENHGLNELLHKENILEDDITVKKNEVPIAWWKDNNNIEHRYYVDILIKSQKRCIEIKSLRTMEKGRNDVYLKKQALEDAGYKCEIWVFNKKGEKLKV